MKKYDECVNYILNIPRFHAKNTPEDTYFWLRKLTGDYSPVTIHVAGTDGKGSTCAFIDSILREAGYNVGLFTSPHLVKINERIAVGGVMISDDEFVRIFQDVKDVVNEGGPVGHPSFFEFVFLMAMRYFSLKKADHIIIETGLGGRLDATNCIPQKDVAVITKLGFDHMEYLGDTLELIAGEKAGIMRAGTPTVFFDNKDEASEVIKQTAKRLNSKCYPISTEEITINRILKENIDFSIQCGYYNYDSLVLGMSASYQTINASLAIGALKALEDKNISELQIREGLRKAFWPGRMEEVLPGVYVDGAHNTDGMGAFLDAVSRRPAKTGRILLFGVVADKQYDLMIEMIHDSGLFDIIVTAKLESERSISVESMKEAFKRFDNLKVSYFDTVTEAFDAALEQRRSPEDEIYAVGSLYLVGQIKELTAKKVK